VKKRTKQNNNHGISSKSTRQQEVEHNVDTSKFKVRSDTEVTAKATLDVLTYAEELGITTWLCYGALLGMVREGRLLPWNNDVELACWHSENTRDQFIELVDKLNSKGYRAYFYSSIGAVAVHKLGVQINLNCFWKDGKFAYRPHETAGQAKHGDNLMTRTIWWLSILSAAYPSGLRINGNFPESKNDWVKSIFVSGLRLFPSRLRRLVTVNFLGLSNYFGGHSGRTIYPVDLFESLEYTSFYGGRALIPVKKEELLSYLYGAEWRIPKDDWSFYVAENKEITGVQFVNKPVVPKKEWLV